MDDNMGIDIAQVWAHRFWARSRILGIANFLFFIRPYSSSPVLSVSESSANLAVIVGLPRVSLLIVR